jgi:molybdopterin synthase sulfur carrier subunit
VVTGTTINVLYFARVAELIGQREEAWPLAQPTTVSELLTQLEARYPALAPASKLKIAVNQYHAGHDRVVEPGDEVAVFEPVTGG